MKLEPKLADTNCRNRELDARNILLWDMDALDTALLNQDWDTLINVHDFVSSTFMDYTYRNRLFLHDLGLWRSLYNKITEYNLKGWSRLNRDGLVAAYNKELGLSNPGDPAPIIFNAVPLDVKNQRLSTQEMEVYGSILSGHQAISYLTKKNFEMLYLHLKYIRKPISQKLIYSHPEMYVSLRAAAKEHIGANFPFNLDAVKKEMLKLRSKNQGLRGRLKGILIHVHRYFGGFIDRL